ncbi:DUF421 domain-containing protein [Paenibacillus jiagnxiensis]|uniref:DUF421 domain-containing protein n=1 Tax=Paenibacillus jiagnxiensis TaxID=3228926 RepID=UPI0033AD5D9E
MNVYMEILIRTVAALVLLLFIAKILGKQTISNMTFLDFVTSITVGSIAANLSFNESINWRHFILAFTVFTLASLLLSVLALKSRKWRNRISGAPTVMIEDGKILEDNMRKMRYTLDSLNQALREKDIFNVDEVKYAVLEDNGKLSVLRKEKYQHATKQDVMHAPADEHFPVELIMDGQVIDKNLQKSNLTREWLEQELQKKGKSISDVFYAVRGTRQQLFFDYYKDQVNKPIDKE